MKRKEKKYKGYDKWIISAYNGAVVEKNNCIPVVLIRLYPLIFGSPDPVLFSPDPNPDSTRIRPESTNSIFDDTFSCTVLKVRKNFSNKHISCLPTGPKFYLLWIQVESGSG